MIKRLFINFIIDLRSENLFAFYLHTPHLPPSLEQYLQYSQVLHALQFLEPVHFFPAL